MPGAQLQAALEGVGPDRVERLGERLTPILTNKAIFGVDLAQVGLADKIQQMVREELASAGAVRRTLRRYLANG